MLLLDLRPAPAIWWRFLVAQALPNAELVVVTTPQPSKLDIGCSACGAAGADEGAGVVENMSYYEHKWARNGSSARAVASAYPNN